MVKSGIMGVNQAAKSFNIPKIILKRRIKSNNTGKCNRLASDLILGAKPPGLLLLILDGHSSHTTNIETLQFAKEHETILFYLSPHTTHFLQSVDRSFFKSLKGHYYDACRNFRKNQANRKLNGSWATVQNAVSGFKAIGIMPFNLSAIYDHAFLVQDPTKLTEPDTKQQLLEQQADLSQPGPKGTK
ncbi:hypothetical protein ILUMI_09317 [Ignelater luminosus]|uniref:DDE-1 domain-containing protein n=1 Tax=Ignelater luminosus TaxID=2038154 RepID=A0A8K0D077_IGNLU|nr:hypothetical protein ILUMI_09317 [Ignelater luminosus]